MPRRATGFTPYSLTANLASGHATMTDIFDKERTDSFSTSMWLNISNETCCPMSHLRVAGTVTGWEWQYTANTGLDFLLLSTATNGVRRRIAMGVFKPGVWQHVVFTYDGSSTSAGILCYVDGVLVTSTSVLDNLTTSTLGGGVNATLGGRSGGSTQLRGQYAVARLHSRVLTAAEVSEMYNSNIAVAVSYEWLMTDGSGTTLTASVGGVNGTITTPVWSATLVPRPLRTSVATVQNLLRRSQELLTSPWFKNGGANVTTTADAGTAPDGTATADRVAVTVGGTNQGIYYDYATHTPLALGKRVTFSIWLKGAVGGETLEIGDASVRTSITLTTSWVRYTNPYHAQLAAFQVVYATTSSTPTFDAWGAQLVEANWEGPYQVTTSAAVNTGNIRSLAS